MLQTLLKTREAPITTHWRGDEIVVSRGGAVIDRLRAGDIDRVTLVHAGEGESPGEVRAAVFEIAGHAVVLGAASGIAGRVLFERQAYWAQRSCIYWINERCVSWPSTARGASRWAPLGRRLPQHRALTPAAVAALFERSLATGPHTWDERKRHRIERRRPFRGSMLGAPHAAGNAPG